jgi:two-component system response regulator EvgA
LRDPSARSNDEDVPLVLIVDDNPSFCANARNLLEREGDDVAEAEDGTSGLACARELAPDLVLLDIQLPDIDGFEIATRPSRLDPAPPVILISSRDATNYGSLVAASPALTFISKDELSGEAIRKVTALG